MKVAGVALGRWRSVRNMWGRHGRRHDPRRSSHPFINLGLVVVLTTLIGAALSMLFGALASQGARAHDAAGMLAIVLLAAIVGMLVFDVHHAVASLLVDSDLELLRRAPISTRALFAIKLTDSLPRTVALLVILALPAVIAFVSRYAVPIWGVALIPVQLLAFWSIPLGLGAAFAVALLRVVPARRAREALGLISTFVLVLLWMANAFWVPRLSESGSELAALLEASATRPLFWDFVSPAHAFASALAAGHDGRAGDALGMTAWLLMLGAASIGLATWTVGRNAFTLQDVLAISPRRVRTARTSGPRFHGGLIRTLIRRDLRLFVRDWTVLGDVLTAAVLWTLLPLLSASILLTAPQVLVRAMLVALTVGLGYEVGARSVPFERRAAMWARLAPLPAARCVTAKFLGTAAIGGPLLVLAVIAMLVAVPLPAREWLATINTAVSALASALALGIWTGIRHGDPDWTNPRAMLDLKGRILAVFLLLGQAGAWLGLATILASAPRAQAAYADLWVPPLVAAVLVRALLRASASQLDRLGWLH
jgi:hypothetical protein